MAIDPLAKITIVDRRHTANRLISRLHDLGSVEVISLKEAHGEIPSRTLMPGSVSLSKQVDEQLHKVNFVLSLLDQFAPQEKSFVAGLAPVPLLVDPAEYRETVAHFDLQEQFERAQQLDEAYRQHERIVGQIQQELAQLRSFVDLRVPLDKVHKLHRLRAHLVELPKAAAHEFQERVLTLPSAAIEPGEGPAPRFWVATLPEDEPAVLAMLKELQGQEVSLPRIQGTVADRMGALKEDLAATQDAQRQTVEQLRALGPLRHKLQLIKAHWENEHRKQQVHGQVMSSQWLNILSGYVRERDLPALQKLLREEFDSASIEVEKPGADADVPVSVTHRPFVKPISLLVTMYGLPRYGSFDPSPFLMVNFLMFFGICFGDVGYGLLLCGASAYLAHRARAYPGLKAFGQLFLYGGISTIFFGLVLGSWFGDLFLEKYLGDDNLLLKLRNVFALFDPMAKPVVALILALFLGMLNQFYGITLRMYDAARVRDWATAIFDGLFWLILLPGLVIVIATLFVPIPRPLLLFAFGLLAVGGTGLVLTQGRCEKSFAGKAAVGVISLYGIFGSYGCTAFIGDVLSYCRLLALGLTTGIVAMSINLIGGMVREVPYVGLLLFVLVLVLGHLFNFAISVLGAFIHSARLIFVEFFGRFYDGGARPFRPLGFNSPSYQLKR